MKSVALIATAAAAAIGAVGANFVVRGLFQRNTNIDQALVQASDQLNRTLPMMVDRETRLDATAPGPGNRLTYLYTLVNVTAADVDPNAMEQAMRPQLISSYKSTPQMATFRDHNVELHYRYKDKAGTFVLEIVVTTNDF